MANKLAVTIGNEVAALIAAASLSQDLATTTEQAPAGWASEDTVIRTFLAEYAMEDMDYVRCTVVPATFDSQFASRSARRETYGIDVVLQNKPANKTAKDALMDLAEEINEVLEHSQLSSAASYASWVGVERTPLFEADRFDEGQMFATSSRHSFRLIRTV